MPHHDVWQDTDIAAVHQNQQASHLLTSRAVHDDLVVMQVDLECAQISVVDAQHAIIQLELQHSLQFTDCVHLQPKKLFTVSAIVACWISAAGYRM